MNLRRKLPSAQSLFVIEAAARLGSFSRASEELNITQPAVSHAVSALERHLGQKLFNRRGPRISLNRHGERLGKAVTHAFAEIESALEEIGAASRQSEVVTLSISTGMATHWLMPRYTDFLERFPDTNLQFQLMPGRVHGPLNDCDLGLRIADAEESSRLDGVFAPERVMVVCSPGYLAEFGSFDRPLKPHTLADLEDYPIDWNDFEARQGVRVDPAWKRLAFSDYSVVVHTALRGQGLALGWTSVISGLLLDGLLVKASEAVIETGRNYHLVLAARRPVRPLVLAVREWLIEQMRTEEIAMHERGFAMEADAPAYSQKGAAYA